MAVTDDQVRDAVAAMRWLARSFPALPPGLSADDLESEGNEALARAAAEYDPACGVEFKTHARHRVRAAMTNCVRRARRRKARERYHPADPETGSQADPPDRGATPPDRMAEVGELVPAAARPGPRKFVTVSRVEAAAPAAAEVARRVTEYQAALHEELTPDDVREVVRVVKRKAKGGNLRAAGMVIALASPARSGVTVQQAVVVQPRDLE